VGISPFIFVLNDLISTNWIILSGLRVLTSVAVPTDASPLRAGFDLQRELELHRYTANLRFVDHLELARLLVTKGRFSVPMFTVPRVAFLNLKRMAHLLQTLLRARFPVE
jgi:hypothetical protein